MASTFAEASTFAKATGDKSADKSPRRQARAPVVPGNGSGAPLFLIITILDAASLLVITGNSHLLLDAGGPDGPVPKRAISDCRPTSQGVAIPAQVFSP